MIIFFTVNDDTKIIGLELDFVQLGVQLLYTSAVLNTILFLTQLSYLSFNFSRSALGIGNAIQLIEPTENLTVCQRYHFIVLSGFRHRQSEIPFRFTQSAAVQFEYVFLAY